MKSHGFSYKTNGDNCLLSEALSTVQNYFVFAKFSFGASIREIKISIEVFYFTNEV